jgi:outer membrane protein OmpA-like peptidoglycan-associated protein
VRLSSAAASPDGDGVNDTVLIRQSSSNETTWVGRFSNAAGTHVRSLTWNGRVTDFEWDGTDQSGVRLPDGVYTYRLFSVDEGDNEAVPSVVQIRLDTTEPEVSVDTYPARFSPDGDGVDDLLRIAITAADAGPLEGWSATMLDPTGQPFVSWSGAGAPPESLYWDGLSENGEVVQSAEVYELDVDVRDVAGNVGSARVDVRIGILVEREGERLRIRISSIYFVPFTSDYVNLDDPERAARNLETLDNLATVLSEYPEYKITIEGHAVSLLWEDPDEARREQREVLVPLSLARAEVIKAALVERGVDPDRMTTVGYGGARPVVPHWDEQNRWKNRRVEFVLEKEE